MTFTPKFADLVRNLTNVTGTGPVTLGSAVRGYSGIAQSLSVGDQFYYCIQSVDKPEEREVGRGTLQPDGRVAREAMSGVPTSFTAGSKTIALVAAAEWFEKVEEGGTGAPASPVFDDLLWANGGLVAGPAGIASSGPVNLNCNHNNCGPQGGPASDSTLTLHNSNLYSGLDFVSQGSMLDGSITSARDDGLYVRGKSKVMLRTDAGFIASIVDSGLNLEPGKVVKVGGTQVLGPQGAAVANATDSASAITQLNALLARLRAHGLIAS